MTASEVISRTRTDHNFAMEFAVDNNLPGVLQALAYYGYNGGNTRAWALSTLKGLFIAGQGDVVKKVFDQTRYINGVDNWTGGLKDYFMRETPADLYPSIATDPDNRLINWNGMLAALGVGLSTYAATTAPNNAYAQTVADQAAAEEEKRKEEEQKEKEKKTWIIVGCAGGALVLIIILVAVFRKPKSKSNG